MVLFSQGGHSISFSLDTDIFYDNYCFSRFVLRFWNIIFKMNEAQARSSIHSFDIEES